MRNIFFTPGPSQLYPTVKKHLLQALREDIPSISHRGQKFQGIYQGTVSGLRQLLNIPDSHRVYFLSSGTEAMERVIENCVGKHSFHFVNGSFSKRFYKSALELVKKAKKYEVPAGEGFIFNNIEIPKEAELICVTQNETSTGVQVPMSDVYALQKQYPDKLIALDIVSSAPYVDVDYKKVDLVFFSVQKGFGLPAGLAVIIVSPKAYAKAKKLEGKRSNIGSYHSFLSLEQYAIKNQTPETPNVLGIYLLGKVVRDIKRLDIKILRMETEEKARLLYIFFDKHPKNKPFVKNEKWRSQTVIVAEITGGSKPLIEKLKKKGLVVGSGYGELKERQIRIANFPAISMSAIRKLLQNL